VVSAKSTKWYTGHRLVSYDETEERCSDETEEKRHLSIPLLPDNRGLRKQKSIIEAVLFERLIACQRILSYIGGDQDEIRGTTCIRPMENQAPWPFSLCFFCRFVRGKKEHSNAK